MGSSESKNTDVHKTVETQGQVNNNVVIDHAVDVTSDEIIILLAIICAIKIIEFIYFLYSRHSKSIKKKYQQNV